MKLKDAIKKALTDKAFARRLSRLAEDTCKKGDDSKEWKNLLTFFKDDRETLMQLQNTGPKSSCTSDSDGCTPTTPPLTTAPDVIKDAFHKATLVKAAGRKPNAQSAKTRARKTASKKGALKRKSSTKGESKNTSKKRASKKR